MDKIQERLDNMSITVKDNETKIKVIEEGLNAQVRDTQQIEQDTIPKLKPKTKDRFEELEHKLKLSEIRDRRYNLLFYGAAESDKPVNEVVRDFLVPDFNMSTEETNMIVIGLLQCTVRNLLIRK